VEACPACGAALHTPLACAACGALLEAPAELSPWKLLGLESSWQVEPAELQKRLVRCSRLMHPDFFAAAPQAARELAGRNSARLNEAYALLLDPARRAEWILTHAGGPSAQAERSMPQAFLMQVLQWNETLEAARGDPAGPGRSQVRAGPDRCGSGRISPGSGSLAPGGRHRRQGRR
jgi:molecular chaperone HscB